MGRGSGAGGGGGGRERDEPQVNKYGINPAQASHVEQLTVDGHRAELAVVQSSAFEPRPGKVPSLEPGMPTRTHVEIAITRQGERITIGNATFVHQGSKLYPERVAVEKEFRRRGLGTKMYAAAEKTSGLAIVPSQSQTSKGRAFAKAYRTRRPS